MVLPRLLAALQFTRRHPKRDLRLADSLPQSKLAELEEELAALTHTDPDRAAAEKRRRIESWLNPGMGCCALAHPEIAETLQDTMLKWDGERYRMIVSVNKSTSSRPADQAAADRPALVDFSRHAG